MPGLGTGMQQRDRHQDSGGEHHRDLGDRCTPEVESAPSAEGYGAKRGAQRRASGEGTEAGHVAACRPGPGFACRAPSPRRPQPAARGLSAPAARAVGSPFDVSAAWKTSGLRGSALRSPSASSVFARSFLRFCARAFFFNAAFVAAEPVAPRGGVALVLRCAGLGPAADRGGDHRAAVAVLVQIRGYAAQRGALLGVRVLAVDRAVGRAVAHHGIRISRRGGRQRQRRESDDEHHQMSQSRSHSDNCDARACSVLRARV